jgi:hypothetical protein
LRISLPNNWTPRRYQLGSWTYLYKGGKRAVLIWHRRSGKDEICLHWEAVSAMRRVGNYWHMLPEAAQARKAIWDAVNPHTGKRRLDEAFPYEIRSTTKEQEMLIKFINGSTWQVVGSDNFNSLLGSPPVGITFSEWALADPYAWAYLRPILAENNGWSIFQTTPRGDNHGKRMYDFGVTEPGWYAEILPVTITKVLTPTQIEAEKREYIANYGMSRGMALFNQEWMCSFSEAFTGKAVYPTFASDHHVSDVSLLPIVTKAIETGMVSTVFRGWDHTGLHPGCVIGCMYGRTLYVFKEFWGDDIGIEDFAEMVKIWCNEHLPDVQYKDYGDPAGNKNRDSRKKTPSDYIRAHCGIRIQDGIQTFAIRVEVVTKRLNLRNGILIDPTQCPLLIEGFLGGYSYPEIGHSGVYKDGISGTDKNKYCDVHDALQYLCTKLFVQPERIHNKEKKLNQRFVQSWASL